MKKNVKTLVSIILVLSLIFAVGCSNNANNNESEEAANNKENTAATPAPSEEPQVYDNGLPKNEKVVLKLGFNEDGAGREWIDYAMKKFTEKYPNVTFDPTYHPQLRTLNDSLIAAKKDEDMFDLFVPAISGGPTPLILEGLLEPQDDIYERELMDKPGTKVVDGLVDGVLAYKPVDGKHYQTATNIYAGGLFYDKVFFEQNGWNQHPKTWDEFVALLESIKSKGIIPITYPGVYAEYIDNAFGVKEFELADAKGNAKQYLEDWANYKLANNFTSPELVEKWTKIYELGKKGYFPKGVAALNHTQSQMQVLQHQAAMVSSGSWIANEMKDATPEGFKWGYMAVPFTNDPNQTIWLKDGFQGGFAIWAAKPELNKKWAKEFILSIYNLDVQTILAEKAGAIPVRKDFTDSSKLQEAPKAVYDYLNGVKYQYADNSDAARLVILKDQDNFKQAKKILVEAITGISEGKTDPVKILEEAEGFMKKAIEAQK